MHPETLKQYELMLERKGPQALLQTLAGPHHFHVSHQVLVVAHELVLAEAKHVRDTGAMVFPMCGRLPAASMILTIPHSRTGIVEGVWALKQRGDEVVVTVLNRGTFGVVGSFFPGTSNFREASNGDQHWQPLMTIAFIMSLINQPRIVEAAPAIGLDWSRQHRKAVERVTGKAAMAFSVVSWKIGKHTKAIGNRLSEEGYPKALHWCRAHWRRAEEGQPKAEWVNIPRKGGWGWYCWAADCWKGHPDFGIKLQRHEPYFEGEPRSRYIDGDSVLDSTRFATMGAAHRAALVEAGFAPSLTVH